MRKTGSFFGVALAMLAISCHRKSIPGGSGTETGMASYYAETYNGKKTANGEIYQSNKLTAAHKKLPFGTKVKVTNLANGKTVKVRINDRGPFVPGRIIDLTRAAAKKIDMVGAGVVKVKIAY
ncbi:septal ring lytic transglycosylase RlpA family protein [Sediminibacterium roseum]|uniref:Probable endolytic peptidoglycan transglycosylase RlpA n=1 Tax=Sediminibacterium roseum TaxID=1978412 RepID=A0ABW9ZNA5_9BACT|nr:septal ring lytic transglycosylase RlpA family protein [Sediminibacterium roseum]NCI48558.1 septal ring lytic transglycosylase RlpA family protein [Sediminibacterium roseum]